MMDFQTSENIWCYGYIVKITHWEEWIEYLSIILFHNEVSRVDGETDFYLQICC